MPLPEYQTIAFKPDKGVGHLIINTPPSNILSLKFFRELSEVLQWITRSPEIRALVISGNGRHFSSGTPVVELKEAFVQRNIVSPRDIRVRTNGFPDQNHRILTLLEDSEIPVVAAITGVCIGSAFELALSCHFRFCSPEAVLGLPETTFNLIPGLGGISRMKALSGMARTIELVLQGRTFSSEEALSYNLVDQIIPRKILLGQAGLFAVSVSNGYKKEKHPIYLKRYFAS